MTKNFRGRGDQSIQTPPEITALIEKVWKSRDAVLDLSHRSLRKLPQSLGQVTHIRILDLSNNKLSTFRLDLSRFPNLETLDLSGNKLTKLPTTIGHAASLRRLYLHDNKLSSLTESIGHLLNLGELYLSNNRLQMLPVGVAGLSRLKVLALANNKLTSLPAELSGLADLQQLDLSGNLLVDVPRSIGELRSLLELTLSRNPLSNWAGGLAELSKLRALDISFTGLSQLPDFLEGLSTLRTLTLKGNQLGELGSLLSNLPSLEVLDASQNRLASFPTHPNATKLRILRLSDNALGDTVDGLAELPQLCHLYINGNRLTGLPSNIGDLSQLEILDAADNQLLSLPESIRRLAKLTSLDLSNNQLEVLPEGLRQLSRLQRIDLVGNEKLGLPIEVLRPRQAGLSFATPSEIRFEPELFSTTARLFTTPLRTEWLEAAFVSSNYSEQLVRGLSESVSIGDFTYPKASDVLEYYFRVRQGRKPLNEAKLILLGRGAVGKTSLVNRLVHDRFDGAQEKTEGIQITEWTVTLSKSESVRLNIWDFGGQEIMHATHQFFLTQRSLYLLVLNGREGGIDSDAEYWLKLIDSFGSDSPVIVVLNKIKKNPFAVNQRFLAQKYPAIRMFIETDCADGTGLEELREGIKRVTDRLEHLRDSFPASWFSIKNELSTTRKSYLTFEEYRRVCKQLGEGDPKAQELLASYLHSLGIALNYRDDPRLQDTHVLNPHWVTNGIYKILNSAILQKQKGEIQLADLGEVLDRDVYPASMHQFLLDLMSKVELCFSFPDSDSRFLVPELLDNQEPSELKQFDPLQCLTFRYDYPILPEGLLPRFIVRTRGMSEQMPRWRTGVVLKFEDNSALVKADVQDKKILISVAGPGDGRRRLLTVVRSHLYEIHKSIKNLQATEMVPLPNYPNIVMPYLDLRVMEQSKLAKFPRVIGGELHYFSVTELLNGLGDVLETKGEAAVDNPRAPLRLFYSYSHKDDLYRQELEKHLKMLQRERRIAPWSDRDIDAGDEWKRQIDDNLGKANIVLLLISIDFISSEYCYELEMRRALERHEKGEVCVIPVIVRDCDWKTTPFAKLKALPRDGQPVADYKNMDTAWREVSEGLRETVDRIQSSRNVR